MQQNPPTTPPARTWHPYRVTRRHDRCAPPLTAPQQAVLEALVHLCPRPGCDASPRAVADAAGMRFGSAMLTLRNLDRRRLAAEHPGTSDEHECTWSPTLFGRSRVRRHNDPATQRRFTT